MANGNCSACFVSKIYLAHGCSSPSYVSIFDKSSVVLSTGHSDGMSETEVCNRSNILRPLNIPHAPFVLQEIISQQLTAHPYSRIETGNLEEEHYQTAVPVRSRPVVR
jgi:hypothetical protein